LFAIVDIEASGSKYPQGRIIDMAILLHDGHQIVREYQTLVNPGHHITDFYQKLTGITNSMLERAPSFNEIENRLRQIPTNIKKEVIRDDLRVFFAI
jgi:DNA polymerase-3 subunit epsilon